MAETEKTQTTEEPAAPPEEFRVPPYRKEDYLTSPENDRGQTASELFGHDPEAVDDKAIESLLGPSDEIVIRSSEPDGGVRETSGKQLRAATKEAVKAAVKPKEAPPAHAAGEQEPEDPPPAETKAEGEPAPGPEAKADAEPEESAKEPTKRQRRRDARYRAMEAKNAALEQKLAEYEKLQQAPAPAEQAAPAEIPKAADFDDDDAHAEAVRAWADQRLQARDAAHAERVRLARDAGAGADDKALDAAVRAEFTQVTQERFKPAEILRNNAAVAAIVSDKLGGAAGSVPVSNFMARRRAQLDAVGALSEDAKSTGEVMADLYGEPKTLAAFENLTGNGHILAGLATLDDPLPVVRYLVSEEGKAKVDDLDRLSATRPEAVAARVVTIAHQALSNGAAASREPAQVEPEISRAPRPGNSPRAAARTQASRQPAPNRADYGELDPDLQAHLDKMLNPRSAGHLQPTG